MFGFRCKRLQLLVPIRSIINGNSVTHLHLCRNPLPLSSSYSSKSLLGSENDKPHQHENGHSFTVSYLIDSFGVSPESALYMSKRVRFNTPEKPDTVIKLFKANGISDQDILKIVRKSPTLLTSNADKTLVPKLEFFGSIGLSGTGLARMLTKRPSILKQSLERCIIPFHDFIKSILVHKEKVISFYKMALRISIKSQSKIASNIAALRALKVPDSTISMCMTWSPLALSSTNEKFKDSVNRVMSLGMHPSSSGTFMRALYVMTLVNASQWEQKVQLYRKWGLTESEFLLAIKKDSLFMLFSEKNVSSKMDFLLNKMDWKPADVAGNPYVLRYSLEKRIIPRCSVIRVLLLRGLLRSGDFSFSSLIHKSEKYFLDKFVSKYQQQVPELLSIYQGKVGLAELGLGIED